MAIIASLFGVAETSPSAATRPMDIKDGGARLLEVRTETGAVYLLPSRWQRIRLQWTFRHFRVLAPQVLSRHDRRLIEKLSRSAVVTPPLPVARDSVLGVVESVHSMPLASAHRVATRTTAPVPVRGFRVKPAIPASPHLFPGVKTAVKKRETKDAPGGVRATNVGDLGFQQWRDLGALAAVGLVVIVASVYGARLFSRSVQRRNPRTLSVPIKHAANGVKLADLHPVATSPLPVSPATTALANAEKPTRLVAPPPSGSALAPQRPAIVTDEAARPTRAGRVGGSTVPAVVLPSAAFARRFVAELPQGYFAHPFVSPTNPAGELRLKALIGVDGPGQEETVLSGSPKLGEVGMPAFPQWHYRPYQVPGSPVAVEPQNSMTFFGAGAVPTASVANGSQPK
jgi:hypothetical protein